jgi:hypothetical protein
MSASNLPDPHTLAKLVSNVTQIMCGISFHPAEARETDPALFWRIAWLPITGGRPIGVALSSDKPGCTALGAALLSCAPESLDTTMIDDSLRELLNMAAGQIKTALKLDQTLGLPKIIAEPDLPPKSLAALREGVVLRSGGKVSMLIWITEADVSEQLQSRPLRASVA